MKKDTLLHIPAQDANVSCSGSLPRADVVTSRAEDLRPAFERAKREVMEGGRVALVDLYTQIA